MAISRKIEMHPISYANHNIERLIARSDARSWDCM